MAYIRIANNEGLETEFKYEIYPEDNENKPKENGSYNYSNGLITQRLNVTLKLGVNTYPYPISFKSCVNSCMVTNESLKDRVRIVNFTKDRFTIDCTLDRSQKIEILATGY